MKETSSGHVVSAACIAACDVVVVDAMCDGRPQRNSTYVTSIDRRKQSKGYRLYYSVSLDTLAGSTRRFAMRVDMHGVYLQRYLGLYPASTSNTQSMLTMRYLLLPMGHPPLIMH